MWPWEHLAFGYLLCTVSTRLLFRRAPSKGAAVALLVGTQLPDVVDKPLSWWLDVLPTGHTLAHSLLVAAPLSASVLAVSFWRGRLHVGWAFAVGYASHLVGDVVYPAMIGRDVRLGFLLWPLVPARPDDVVDPLAYASELFRLMYDHLISPEGATYLLLELFLLGTFVLLWALDGFPGLPRQSS